ncbi:NodT family RND efflux system outer membrane lipoprotein [Sulfuritalea hydrogenivorans sk43H]|uniref:NodT family RND efflux system outer membrane lipoprotein n=2 Tax=Sulfuritalea hydrogenivorans TaxID=748811 RepID=W0SCU1_9PROT|nr:NodT family RND efflux system outer membrane lipoprotein [Sulfuritalea hydrogenivorans sk43H]
MLACIVGLATGCAEVGDYQRPASGIPAQWRQSTPGAEATPVAQIQWRSFFQDQRLQALITSALEHNSDLKMALARVAETRAQYGIANADRLPSASLAANKTKSKIPAAFTGTDRPVTTERTELNLTVVSFELDFWGRIANLSEAARASYLASESASRAMRITLIAEVANLYFTLLELNERIDITRTAIESRRKNRDLVKRGMELGAAARSDYLLAEGAFHFVEAELAVLENQQANTEHALFMLVGNPAIDLPKGRKLHEQEVRNDLAPGIPSEVLYARPDVIAAEHRLREANANVAAARAAFLPKILLTVGIGLASRSLSALFGPGSGNWTYQPALSLPLFDGGRTAGFEAIAEARRNSAVADYEKTIQQAFREVSDLLSTRASLADQRRATEATVKAHQERLTVAEMRFKSGSISYLEVLDAQRELFASQQGAVQVRRAQLSTAAQLYKALGGGDTPEG